MTRTALAIGGPEAPLAERLREGTQDLHEELERCLDWRQRMATRDGYLTLLARWWGFHRVFEPIVGQAFGRDVAWPRRKLHLIERDLVHFGMNREAIEALPRFAAGTGFDDRPAILGALYVTEGSTLGGQVIAHHIRRSLGDAIASGGCAYYEGYGKRDTAAMWTSFRTFLDRSGDEGRSESVIEGARWTFDALRLWLTAGNPPRPASGEAARR